MSAPNASALARRAGEKSAASTGPKPRALRPAMTGQSDRAAADHHRHPGIVERRQSDRMQPDGERLGQRGVGAGEAIGHRQQNGLGEQHRLGKATGQPVREANQLGPRRP